MLCNYGCGQEANFQMKNGKWCCSDYFSKCPAMKKKNGDSNKGKFPKGQHPNSGKTAWNKGVPRTEEEKEKISQRTKEEMSKPEVRKKISEGLLYSTKNKKENHPRWNGGYYDRNIPRYDLYAHKIEFCEEVKRNESDPNILEVKCTKCNNWFIPKVLQVYERIRSLYGKNYGEQRFYCSDECKHNCPLYHYPTNIEIRKMNNSTNNSEPYYTQQEYHIFRTFVLERDNYICQYCGKLAEHVHHERPQKLEPFFSLDPDLAWSVCSECHYKKGHKKDTECNIIKIANKEC